MMGREIEVDAICDGDDILIPGIMEHFERAGVHSGDSISIYPSINIEQKHKDTLVKYTGGSREEPRCSRSGQHPVRAVQRPDLRYRGKPAFVPYRAVHLQGYRLPASR